MQLLSSFLLKNAYVKPKPGFKKILTKNLLRQHEYTPSNPLPFTARYLDPKTLKTLMVAIIRSL
jgi:hypothetical protein